MSLNDKTCALLISTYNWPEALRLVLKSVKQQTRIPDEVIIADDGSGETPESVIKRPKPIKAKPQKIVSKSSKSSIVLPEFNVRMPDLPDASQSLSALAASGLASGGDGGFGGGSETGIGIGIGNARNYVGQFAPRKVMGANILAEKVAVYLDCSGSMSPYLPQVRQEIYDKYPDADIFEFDGIRTLVHDGEIVGGKRYKDKGNAYNNYGIRLDGTEKDRLSSNGKRIYKKYAENFEQGSVGAWLDIMLNEKYDALVIFSDFQDGIRNTTKTAKRFSQIPFISRRKPTGEKTATCAGRPVGTRP